jgi:hypothetical protein
LRKFVYVKVYPGQLVARVFGEPREFAVDCAGLVHPRSLIGTYDGLVESFAKVVAESGAISLLFIQPRVLIHLISKVDGGYTQPELRACRQAAIAAGFVSPLLCGSEYGPLSDRELEEIRRGFRL